MTRALPDGGARLQDECIVPHPVPGRQDSSRRRGHPRAARGAARRRLRLGVQRVAVAAVVLGLVQRHVGEADQGLEVGRLLRAVGHAQAGGDAQRPALDEKGLAEGVDDTLRDERRVRLVVDVGQVMKASGGRANPKLVNDLLRKALDG